MNIMEMFGILLLFAGFDTKKHYLGFSNFSMQTKRIDAINSQGSSLMGLLTMRKKQEVENIVNLFDVKSFNLIFLFILPVLGCSAEPKTCKESHII
jgi:hypothetical protein